MGRYNFVSEGAAASEAIARELLQRQQLLRQAALDEEARAARKADDVRADAQLALQQKQDTDRLTHQATEDKIRNAGIAVNQAVPGVISGATAGQIKGTPYEARLDTRSSLPSRGMTGDAAYGVLAPRESAGGESMDVLLPTQEQETAAGQRAARSDLTKRLESSGHGEAAGFIGAGLTPPASTLGEDPAVAAARGHQYRLEEILAQNEGALKVAGVRAANSGAGGGIDYTTVAQGVLDGRFPPDINPRSQYGMRLQAEIAKLDPKFDLSDAVGDWRATQRWLQSVNGTQQTRFRQAIDTSYNSLDLIDSAAKRWKAGRFPALNKVVLQSAKQGLLGKDANQLATQLEGEIGMLRSELAQVSMGGNSPTDHAFELASSALASDWDEQTLLSMTQLARRNLDMRRNSVRNAGAVTVGDNPYTRGDAAPAPTPARGTGPGPGPGPGTTTETAAQRAARLKKEAGY